MRISFPHPHLCPENGYEGWAAIWETQKFISSEKLNKSKRFPCCVRKSIFCRLAANKSATSHDSRVTCGGRGKFLRLKSTSTLEACGNVHKYHDNDVNIWLLKIVWVFKTIYVHCHEQFFSRKCQICSIGCGPTSVWCHNNVSQCNITGWCHFQGDVTRCLGFPTSRHVPGTLIVDQDESDVRSRSEGGRGSEGQMALKLDKKGKWRSLIPSPSRVRWLIQQSVFLKIEWWSKGQERWFGY